MSQREKVTVKSGAGDTGKYDDLMFLPHHVSPARPKMSLIDRAAQFSPFAALSGYDSAIRETARQTDEFVLLDEDHRAEVDLRLRWIKNHMKEEPQVSITYFLPDEKKSGGAYVTATGAVKKIDEYENCVWMSDRTVIPIEKIYEIDGQVFAGTDFSELS